MSLPASLRRPGRRTVAALAGLGLLCGAGTAYAASTFGSEPAPATTEVALPATGQAALVAERKAAGASRSTARTSVTGLTAPKATSAAPATRTGFGVTGVKAVAKPKPEPVETSDSSDGSSNTSTSRSSGRTSRSGSTGSSSTGSSSSNTGGTGSGSQYAAAGARLGLGPNAQRVYSEVRSRFGISNIGGYRPGDSGDHGSGNAVDVMTTGATGDAVAAYAIANAGRLNIKYVIWKQRVWLPNSGWRGMADRGSPTQNHFDHVHISVY